MYIDVYELKKIYIILTEINILIWKIIEIIIQNKYFIYLFILIIDYIINI